MQTQELTAESSIEHADKAAGRWSKVVRELSGVTRQEILKRIFMPATHGTEVTTKGEHIVYNIDHTGDECYISINIPGSDTIRDIDGVYLVLIGKSNTANMPLTVAETHGAYGETVQATHSHDLTRTTATDTYDLFDISGTFTLDPGHQYGFAVRFKTSTNLYVIGLLVVWT